MLSRVKPHFIIRIYSIIIMNRLNLFFTKKRWQRGLIEAACIVGVFSAITWWQTKDLLPNKTLAPMASLDVLPIVQGDQAQLDWGAAKPTLLYFFAPWCRICHFSIDNLSGLKKDYPESTLRIGIVALSYHDIAEVKAFLRDHKMDIPVLLGNPKVAQRFNVSAFPTYYLIDKSNQVISKSVGYSTELGLRIRALKI